MKPEIHLLTRADDAGSCRSANEAILEGVEAGIIKNVSFMAVGPHVEHATQLLGGRDDIAYGFHVCLNAEWERVKWKPLSGAPVLVDEEGFFLPFPQNTQFQIKAGLDGKTLPYAGAWNYDVHDLLGGIASEIKEQFKKLRDLSLPISYVDEHMGVSWIGFGLRDEIARLCRHNALVDAHSLPSLPQVESETDGFAKLERQLATATGARYVWITHPGKVAPDMNNFYLKGGEPGVVARERDAERALLVDERLPALLEKWRVKLARYDDLK